MERLIQDYLRILQRIAIYKGDDEYATTPYTFNMMRTEAHEKLFEELYHGLSPICDREESFWRSKDLFGNLDKIFRLYNAFELDLKDREHLIILSKDLMKFLSSTEVKYYLEGRTSSVHNVIENL